MKNTAPKPAEPIWTRSYPDGVRAHLDYGTETLVEQFERAASRHGDRVAIDFFGATTTYAQTAETVNRVAAALLDLGVTAGDRVAILLPSCPQNVIATQAVMRIGAVAVQHNPLYTAHELTQPLADHAAKVAICWDKIAPMLTELAEKTPLEHVVGVNMTHAMPRKQRLLLTLPIKKAREAKAKLTAPLPDGVRPWSSLTSHAPLPDSHPRPQHSDVAITLYTSGTSGQPKGVPLTHANLAANALQGKEWAHLREGEEVFLVVLPMFHAYGLSISILAGINLGARLLMLPAPEIPLIMAAIKRCKPTFLPAVPPLYARILDEASKKKVDLHGIRVGLSGAMSLPPQLVTRWEEATGGFLIEGYGLTETSPVVVGNPMSDARRAGSIGVPYPDVEIRLADVDDVTKDAAPGGPGELLVKGPQVFGGYYNRPQESAEAFHDGFFRTGDVVEQDADGFLTIVDRIKELIVTGGFNVYPSEVEEVLRQHDSVEDAAVVGLPARNGGEDVVAAVVMADGASEPDVDALRAHVKSQLTAYKAPRRIIAIDELPRNPMGKVLRREVQKIVRDKDG